MPAKAGTNISKPLGRLLQNQHKRSDARRLLARVYDSFTEGFDMPDLKDARSVLGQSV
jgi:hypothetical protein